MFSGFVSYTEAQLLALVQGNNLVINGLSSWLRNNFDTTDFSRPNAYLIYTLYDQDLNIVPESSGALRVVNPEQLGDLAALEIAPTKSGYLHVGACPELSEWVANSSAQAVNWDEVQITRLRGTVREINHYYPYGLQLMGIDNEGKSYPYKYGSKELQQDAWARQMVLGGDFINLDWLDFEARMYDPTVARWYNPDPAEQFMNPYLAMGNSPTVYVDPDGQIAFIAVVGIFAGVQLLSNMIRSDFKMNAEQIGLSLGLGALQGALAFAGPAGIGAYSGCGAGWLSLGSAVAGQINIPLYKDNNFSLSISPSLATGTNGVRLGANAFASATIGNATVSMGYSMGRNFDATDLSGNLAEAKWSSITSGSFGWSGSGWGASYGLTHFGGNYSSTVGRFGFSAGRFAFSHENDFLAPGNQDKYRTGRINASWQLSDDVAIAGGFEVFTGKPIGTEANPLAKSGEQYIEDSYLRNGISSLGVQYRGNDYRIGWNSEGARAKSQNGWHDSMRRDFIKAILRVDGPSPWFRRMSYSPTAYTFFGNVNPFSGYGF